MTYCLVQDYYPRDLAICLRMPFILFTKDRYSRYFYRLYELGNKILGAYRGWGGEKEDRLGHCWGLLKPVLLRLEPGGSWGAGKCGVNLYPGGIFHGIRGTEVDLL